MKKPLITVLAFSILFVSQLQAQSSKTLVKSFPSDGITTLVFNLPGDATVKTHKENLIRIQMSITLDNFNETKLKALIAAGRYNLEKQNNEQGQIITAPNFVKNDALKEKISYQIAVPEHLLVQLKQDTQTSALPLNKDNKGTLK